MAFESYGLFQYKFSELVDLFTLVNSKMFVISSYINKVKPYFQKRLGVCSLETSNYCIF